MKRQNYNNNFCMEILLILREMLLYRKVTFGGYFFGLFTKRHHVHLFLTLFASFMDGLDKNSVSRKIKKVYRKQKLWRKVNVL